MSSTGGRPVRQLPTPELEHLLNSGIPDPRLRGEVEDELRRRFQQDLGAGPPVAPPAAVPPPWNGPPGPPAAAAPPPPPAPAARKGGAVAGCVSAVLVALGVGAVIAFLQGWGEDDPGPRQFAVQCVTPAGACPLAETLPVGADCYCAGNFGVAYGYAQ